MPAPASLPSLAELRVERLQTPPTNGIRILRNGSLRFVNPFDPRDDDLDSEPEDGERSRGGGEENKDGKGERAAPAPPEPVKEEVKKVEQDKVDGDDAGEDEDANSDGKPELETAKDGEPDAVDVGKEPECRRQVDELFVEEDGRVVATFPVDAYWDAPSQKGPGVAKPGFTAEDYAAIEGHFTRAGAAFRDKGVQSLQMHGVGFGIGQSGFFSELFDAVDSQCTFLYAQTTDKGWGETNAQWSVGECPDGRIRALLTLVRNAKPDQLDHLKEVFASTCYTLELSAADEEEEAGEAGEDGEDGDSKTSVYRTVERMLVWLPKRDTDLTKAPAHCVRLVPTDADAFLNGKACRNLVENRNWNGRIGGNQYTPLWRDYYLEGADEDGVDRRNAVLCNRVLNDLFGLWWATRKLVYGDLDDARVSAPEGVGAFRKVWNAVEWTSADDVVQGDGGRFKKVERLRFPVPPFEVDTEDPEVKMKLPCPSRPIVQTVVQMKSSIDGLYGAVGIRSFGSAYVGLLFHPERSPLFYDLRPTPRPDDERGSNLVMFCNNVAEMGMHAVLQVLEVTTAPWSGTRFCTLYEGLVDGIQPVLDETERGRIRELLDELVATLRMKRDELLTP
jgi:hypothetical protein